MEQRVYDTGLYVVDRDYRILTVNRAVREAFPEVQLGDTCYHGFAMNDEPCQHCPIKHNHRMMFFNPKRRMWISANAATIDMPEHGECYCIQFRNINEGAGTKEALIEPDVMDQHIAELQSITGRECVIGAYFEPGSPLFFANDNMVKMLGYDTVEELSEAINGLVVNTVYPEDRPRVRQDMNRIGFEGATYETTYRMPRKDGSWFWAATKGKVIRTPAGRLATLSVCTDMSELLKRHESLASKHEQLKRKDMLASNMVENMPSGYHRCKAEAGCPFLYIGKYFLDIIGWTKEEIEHDFGNLYSNLIWDEDRPVMRTYEEMLSMRGNGNVYDTSVYRMKHKDGGYRWVTDSTMFVDLGEESYFQSNIVDITPYIEELEKARREAEASNMAKSTFLFNASHDIRTPMNAIFGYTSIIEQHAGDEEIVRANIAKAKLAGETLMTLLNDVLELSRIENGKDELKETPTDLNRQVNKLYDMFESEMAQRQIAFSFVNNIRHAAVKCDDLKLIRVGMNMLSNAKKFTPAGGEVNFGVEEISCDGQQATFRFYVHDTGIGMSEEFLQRAFDQFERERTSTNSGVMGSGLGLAIIKRLVTLMGGECQLTSELGKGTEIAAVLTFPLADDDEIKLVMPDVKQADFTGKRILLVEDNEFNREIARYVLEGMRFAVEEAENGAVCVEKLLRAEPGYYDVILMDIQMPVMDGYTATRYVRKMKDMRLASIPIIAMTANAFDEDKRRCMEAGMNGHIGKPIEPEMVMQALMQTL